MHKLSHIGTGCCTGQRGSGRQRRLPTASVSSGGGEGRKYNHTPHHHSVDEKLRATAPPPPPSYGRSYRKERECACRNDGGRPLLDYKGGLGSLGGEVANPHSAKTMASRLSTVARLYGVPCGLDSFALLLRWGHVPGHRVPSFHGGWHHGRGVGEASGREREGFFVAWPRLLSQERKLAGEPSSNNQNNNSPDS